jgi:hypothetical protein
MFPAVNLNYFMQYVTIERNHNPMQKSVTKPQSRYSYSKWASLTQNILNIFIYKRILST